MGAPSVNASSSVFTYVGTPPPLRRLSKLTWRQGPCHLIEDVISAQAVTSLYQLGPNYIGNFQAPVQGS